ncbi:hypothetical protein GMORB2_6404 [Geosmithia morbida]|uniref:Uncharacterized protein n=1 Tax=Geosmithia morbida TaxID=1094350 RepID=A0A9P4YXW8_9HYPO|nr:uncharacterized protein GMORB2_6404 [Geosmithia morbida]KAF4123703.1 hypothetical protein GMORB2_6404 [Geosmithia morbida]
MSHCLLASASCPLSRCPLHVPRPSPACRLTGQPED